MLNNSDTSPRSRVVRWTDDEWAQIASHLYTQVRTLRLKLSDFKELKAKDVFLAQRVLPEDRHRKLVSIAQGFGGIRTKLSAVLQSFSQSSQQDLVHARRLECDDGEQILQMPVSAHDQARGGGGPLVKAQFEADKTAETITADSRTASTGSVTNTASPVQARNTGGLISESEDRIAEQTLTSNNERDRQFDYLLQKARASTGRLATVPGGPGLIEMARPFVAMVCEEIIKTFFSVMSTEGLGHAMPVSIQKGFVQRAPTQQADLNKSRDVWRQGDTRHERPSQTRIGTTDSQPEPSSFSALLDDHPADTGEVEAEVQPLFDPKLPPSANSEFKPRIGLVSRHADDFEDLPRLYPQFDLTIVQANTIADVRKFGHCQRIIALRDDLLPSTDELLAEQLRHRYVPLSGGPAALKSQLNAWLQASGSITTAPRRAASRGNEAPDHGMPKKKQNRYPRMIGR
jgi:hypothetical protein